ncbi:hypothetical protein I79_001419 [Cricetulus griseus]|uniref:Uncharacterized protein n=1 Tax=Cricetulus griseus TaxID=10029 RepID=G3GUQ2_CRIGR|nr:hypothetical protein I79_001419 [Cricetulus griseus]
MAKPYLRQRDRDTDKRKGLERWLSGSEYLSLMQKTQVLLSAPTLTLVPGYLLSSSDLHRDQTHDTECIFRQNIYM